MAKFDSPKQVFRALNSKNNNNSAKTPTESCIRKIYKKFCQTGSVLDKLKGSKVKKLEETKKNEITDILAANPKSSLTAISQSVDISRTTIWRFIKYQLHCKSYIIQTHQELYEEDFDRRLEMAEIVLPMLESRELAGLIFFSDEATFHTSGYVHKNNCRIWGTEKPNEVNSFERDSPKVNVWCAMSSNCIIGPYFFDVDTVKGTDYLKMLNEYFLPILRNKRIVRTIRFQQDGAPPHYATTVRKWLNDTFPGRWIGRRGPIEWAPRSPDLTPLDFYLWGYVKQVVYKETIHDLNDLRQKIIEAVNSINTKIISSVFLNLKKRLQKVKDVSGGHIEHLM